MKIARSENLPVLPQVVSSVLKMADDPNASPRSMERLVEQDPALTAKVLRVANSTTYAGGQVSSAGRALSILGLNTVRSLVVAVAYQQVIAGKQASSKFNKLDFWRHSLATANAARILGKLKAPMKAEELYCAGLLHDVGYLVCEKFAPAELDASIEAATQQGIPLHKAEQSLHSYDHAVLGGLLAEKWGLQGILGNAIRYHHEPEADLEFGKTTAFITIADAIANECGFRNQVKHGQALTKELQRISDLPDEQIPALKGAVASEVEKAIFAFQIKSGSPRC